MFSILNNALRIFFLRLARLNVAKFYTAAFCAALFFCPQSSFAKAKLGVLIVFDQLRAEDVITYSPHFGAGGFGGLAQKGAHLDVHYQNATTTTATGHATLSTGAEPKVHGIASNGWLHNGAYVYVASQPGAQYRDGADEKGYGQVGPLHLQAPTLGDSVKAATLGKGKVVSLSIKDRAAIFTAGKSADLVMWYRRDKGVFTTSTAYPALPSWAIGPAVSLPNESMSSGEWSPLPAFKNAPALPADDVKGEHIETGLRRVFPHHLKSLKDKKTARNQYVGTPQSMNDLFSLAELAVKNMKLGKDDAQDLLIINISSSDYIGHWFGPQSLESVDFLRRADLRLRMFMQFLDAKVGRDQYALALSSDHGAPPLPERMQKAKVAAGRIHWKSLRAKLEKSLASFSPRKDKAGNPQQRIAALIAPHLYIRLDDLSEAQQEQARIILKKGLLANEGIAEIYDAKSCEKKIPADSLAELYCASFVPERSGDFILRPHPYWVFSSKDGTGISHGSGYLYSRAVPLFLRGKNIRRGRFSQAADARDVAVTLAAMMGIPAPAASSGKVLPQLSSGWSLLRGR